MYIIYTTGEAVPLIVLKMKRMAQEGGGYLPTASKMKERHNKEVPILIGHLLVVLKRGIMTQRGGVSVHLLAASEREDRPSEEVYTYTSLLG